MVGSIGKAGVSQIKAALTPQPFKYVEQLANYMRNNATFHEKSRYVILPKPYGISCVGERQEDGGIFETSIRDEEKKERLNGTIIKRNEEEVTISDCIPMLKRYFDEPGLKFCTGLKRYTSGAIVLPCNPVDFDYLKASIKRVNADHNTPYHYNALAITINRPPEKQGYIQGFATFQQVGKHKEYVFVESAKKPEKRAISGKFAVYGRVEYELLGEANGCSLVRLAANKFARHLPRLALSSLMCPILGDAIYSSRLYDVDGIPTLIAPNQKYRTKNLPYFPAKICDRFDMKEAELRPLLPMYLHVFQTVFPLYGQPPDVPAEDEMYLLAGTPPQAHFLAALNVLQLRKPYEEFLKRNEEEQQQQRSEENST